MGLVLLQLSLVIPNYRTGLKILSSFYLSFFILLSSFVLHIAVARNELLSLCDYVVVWIWVHANKRYLLQWIISGRGLKQLLNQLLINYFDNRLILWVIFQIKMPQTFTGFSFSNVKIYYFSWFYSIVNRISLHFGLLVRQKNSLQFPRAQNDI